MASALRLERPLFAPLLFWAVAGCQAFIDVEHPLTFADALVLVPEPPGAGGGGAGGSDDAGGDALGGEEPFDGPVADPLDGSGSVDAESARGDLSFRPTLPDFLAPPPMDSTVRPPPEDCASGADEDLDLLVDCEDPDCAGAPCSDGEACTFDDHCDALLGACAGTALVCQSDACVLRACAGGPLCEETLVDAGAACDDDGDPCTDNVCDGEGGCRAVDRGDGALCNGDAYEFRCCGGDCVNVFMSDAHCGGCGIGCGGRGCVSDVAAGIARISCNCSTNAQCQAIAGDYTCFQNRCNCQSDAGCDEGQTCVNINQSPNTCHYP